ncbi:MAG: EthD family reductase [Alphaproteobacteria bacterium]
MSVSYFVRYQNLGSAAAAFVDYYRHRHAPILAEFPGLRSLVLHTPIASADPFPTSPDPTEFLAQMVFDSPEALNRALASEARRRARDDFPNFPPFGGPATHLAMRAEKIR